MNFSVWNSTQNLSFYNFGSPNQSFQQAINRRFFPTKNDYWALLSFTTHRNFCNFSHSNVYRTSNKYKNFEILASNSKFSTIKTSKRNSWNFFCQFRASRQAFHLNFCNLAAKFDLFDKHQIIFFIWRQSKSSFLSSIKNNFLKFWQSSSSFSLSIKSKLFKLWQSNSNFSTRIKSVLRKFDSQTRDFRQASN